MNTETNTWQTLSTRNIYENPWIKVEEDQIINPTGKAGIYGKVLFKNKAIGVLAIDNEGFIYLVGQFRYPLNEYSWEIPEGGCPIGEENPIEAAKRELKEETGLIAEKWSLLNRIHTSNSVTDEEGFIFLAENLSQHSAEPEETEDLKVKKVLLTDAVQMVLKSEITDSISMAAILIAARKFNV
ncbi:MAG: NUDIX hydrolase [Bacteroidetes bacterium]|nr:MAG: NUDIX hydrolase [Bacteroidota bacterium]